MSDSTPISESELDALEQGFESPPSSEDPVRLWEIVLKLCRAGVRLTRDLRAERAEVERLRGWVDDLQSGMYVNCVYCGHRYGPGETTPASMADALKVHVEQREYHPMAALKSENARLRERLAALEGKLT